MDLGVGPIEEIGNHLRALQFVVLRFRGVSGCPVVLSGGRRGGGRGRGGNGLHCWFWAWLIRLEGEKSIFLVAFGREADVVKLNFVHTGLGYELGQSNVVILHLRVRGISPDKFAILAPGLA